MLRLFRLDLFSWRQGLLLKLQLQPNTNLDFAKSNWQIPELASLQMANNFLGCLCKKYEHLYKMSKWRLSKIHSQCWLIFSTISLVRGILRRAWTIAWAVADSSPTEDRHIFINWRAYSNIYMITTITSVSQNFTAVKAYPGCCSFCPVFLDPYVKLLPKSKRVSKVLCKIWRKTKW